MTNKYEVGGKLRYVGEKEHFFTYGHAYEIHEVYPSSLYLTDNNGDEHGMSYEWADSNFELVTEESPRTESDLIANLALRVSELERALAPKSCTAEQTEDNGDTTDNVNHPSHYTQGGVEVIDIIRDAVKGADPFEAVCLANVLKYTLRYKDKNGVEDLRKAEWYLGRLIAEVNG